MHYSNISNSSNFSSTLSHLPLKEKTNNSLAEKSNRSFGLESLECKSGTRGRRGKDEIVSLGSIDRSNFPVRASREKSRAAGVRSGGGTRERVLRTEMKLLGGESESRRSGRAG